VEGADYFSNLIADSDVIIFDDCGHFISYDQPKETAKHIINFLDIQSYCIIEGIE
jgi:pimeloyl-ACP methyl ester carboxylesterase